MPAFELRIDEVVLLHAMQVRWREGKHGGRDELVLTNLHLIIIDRGVLGRAETTYIPLSQIKTFSDRPQAFATKGLDGRWQVGVFLMDRQVDFIVESGGRRSAIKWADAICAAAGGRGTEVQQRANYAIPGTEHVVEALRDTFGQAAKSLRRRGG